MITRQKEHIFRNEDENSRELRLNSYELSQMRIYGIKRNLSLVLQ